MHFCALITAAFIVISALGASADDATTDQTTTADHCVITNLENVEGIDKAIFYVITQDCRFYAWRNGHIPRGDEVGLNGTKKLIQSSKSKKVDRLGAFVDQLGLSKKCAKDSGAFVFGHREGEGRPELVFMTPYEPGNWVLLRIPIEDYLEKVNHVHKSLIAEFEETGVMVQTAQNLSTCAFYKAELQCFWLTEENKLHVELFEKHVHKSTNKDEYIPINTRALTALENRRMLSPMAALYESGTVASVFMYDPLTDGWLYRWNDVDRTASNEKLVQLNTIPMMNGQLASISSLDRATMLLTKCTTIECHYYWGQLQIESKTPYTCLFLSKRHTLAGVITDVRLPEILPEAEAAVAEAFIANSFMALLALTEDPYWPVILLVVVSVLIFLLVLCCLFICESFGFKRRLVMEKVMDTKYARIFWPDTGDIVALTLSDIETAEAASSQALATEASNPHTPHGPTSSQRSSVPLQSPPMTSRLLFTEEENKTASSLKHSSPHEPKFPKTVTPNRDIFTSTSSHPGFVNVRYATHQPPVLNPRKAPDARKSRITPAIPDAAPSPAARKDAGSKPREVQEDDALASVRVEPLKEDEQLVDAPYTPATLKSRARKASKAKRIKRKASTPRGEMPIDRTQDEEKDMVSMPSKEPWQGSMEPSKKRLAPEEPFKLSVRDAKREPSRRSQVSRKDNSNVSREPVAMIEQKQMPSVSSTQPSASNKRKELPTDATQDSASAKKPQRRQAGTPTRSRYAGRPPTPPKSRYARTAASPGTKYYSVQGGKPADGTKYYSVQGGKPDAGTKYYSVQGPKPDPGTKYYSVQGPKPDAGTKYYSVQGPKPDAGTKYYSVQDAPKQRGSIEKTTSTYVSPKAPSPSQPSKSHYGSAKTSGPKNSQYLGQSRPSTAPNKSTYAGGVPQVAEKSHDSTDLRTASSRSQKKKVP